MPTRSIDTPRLEARSLSAGYHGVPAIRDLDLALRGGEMVLLAGPNGAGKSTTVRALAGAIRPLAGEVLVDGRATRAPVHRRVRGGLGLVPEERAIFRKLTVAENLRLGRADAESVLELFPPLTKRRGVAAGLTSGGEQQMLALGRVLAAQPTTILVDELSLGLAPIIVQQLFGVLRTAADEGAAVLIVEQHLRSVLPYVDRCHFLRRGSTHLDIAASDLDLDSPELRDIYL